MATKQKTDVSTQTSPVKKSRVKAVKVTPPKTLAAELQERMTQQNISARYLSESLSVSRHEVRRLLTGGNLSVETATRLSLYFHTSISYWLDLHKTAEFHRLGVSEVA